MFVPYSFLKKTPIYLSLYKNKTDSFQEVLHFHPGIEILYIHEGKGRAFVEQQIFELTPGKIVFFKPHQLHHVQMETSPDQPYIRSLFIFDPSYMLDYLKPFPTLYQFLHYLWKDPSAVQALHQLNQEQFEAFIRGYMLRFEQHPLRDPREEHRLFLMAVLHFLQPLWEQHNEQLPLPFPPAVIQIMKWIEENYQEPFRLEILARLVHMTPNHVSYLFHHATGNTITEYLTLRRLKEACRLLMTTSFTVSDIGLQVGWSNPQYFCQVFKKKLGMTPNEYRSQSCKRKAHAT